MTCTLLPQVTKFNLLLHV